MSNNVDPEETALDLRCLQKPIIACGSEIVKKEKKKKIKINTKKNHHITNTRLLKYIENFTRRGGSNEYPQSMFLSRNKKKNVYPCKPQFYYIKVGFKGVKIT